MLWVISSFADDGPTLKRYWLYISFLLGHDITIITHVACFFSSKQDTLIQCCFNAGPPSATLAQHLNNIGSKALVCKHDEYFNNGTIIYEGIITNNH